MLAAEVKECFSMDYSKRIKWFYIVIASDQRKRGNLTR
jgi:hypothetical protein